MIDELKMTVGEAIHRSDSIVISFGPELDALIRDGKVIVFRDESNNYRLMDNG